MRVLGGQPSCPLVLGPLPISVGDSHLCMNCYNVLCSESVAPDVYLSEGQAKVSGPRVLIRMKCTNR